jgi:hypothetical protein
MNALPIHPAPVDDIAVFRDTPPDKDTKRGSPAAMIQDRCPLIESTGMKAVGKTEPLYHRLERDESESSVLRDNLEDLRPEPSHPPSFFFFSIEINARGGE